MEFKEVVGRRRSIRFFQPWRSVEREKIQTILEAARLASCAVNAHWLRAIVVERDKLPRETLDTLKTPVSATNIELAPVHIYFYADLGTVPRVKGARLKELVDVGALAPSHGWSHKFVDDFVWPQILEPMTKSPAQHSVGAATDCGVAICQALLCAFDEGLGACLSAFNPGVAKQAFAVPDDWLPLYVMLVGYPAESWQAGGQRPRPPFEELYFEGKQGTPFRRDGAVVEKLKEAQMIQAPAPLPWRRDEIRSLARMFGLPE
ncbi:MAG: nitroreductase family protein [Chloroflexi bacterium]|nr:nitroreductase family protein [Chloroflexota bacterium]